MSHQYTDRVASRSLPERGVPGTNPDFIASIVNAARANPMSAALIGLGALWLFTGGRKMSLLSGPGRSSVITGAAHGAGHLATEAAHSAGRVGSAVSSGLSSAASGLGEALSNAGDYVRGTVHGVDACAEYRNEDVSLAGSDVSSGHSRSNRHFVTITGLRENMYDLFESHPWALGLAGLVVGMGVAASLPMTKQETETLGNARDAVGEKVSEVTKQASEIAGAAFAEAKRQGLGSAS